MKIRKLNRDIEERILEKVWPLLSYTPITEYTTIDTGQLVDTPVFSDRFPQEFASITLDTFSRNRDVYMTHIGHPNDKYTLMLGPNDSAKYGFTLLIIKNDAVNHAIAIKRRGIRNRLNLAYFRFSLEMEVDGQKKVKHPSLAESTRITLDKILDAK